MKEPWTTDPAPDADLLASWRAWVRERLPEHCREPFDRLDGCLEANLYAMMTDLARGHHADG